MDKTPEQDKGCEASQMAKEYVNQEQLEYDEAGGAYYGFLAGYQAAKDEMNSPKKLDSWISVKERLPEIPDTGFMSEDVLWLTRYGEIEVSCLERLHSEFRVDWGEAGLLRLDQFTHWMPLPELPKDE